MFLYGDGAKTGGISLGNSEDGFSSNLWDDGSTLNLSLIDGIEFKVWNDKDGESEKELALFSTTGIELTATTTAKTVFIVPIAEQPSETDACTDTDAGAVRIDSNAAAGSRIIWCDGSVWQAN